MHFFVCILFFHAIAAAVEGAIHVASGAASFQKLIEQMTSSKTEATSADSAKLLKFEADDDVVFKLFTPTADGNVVKLNDIRSLKKSTFDPKNPTRFIIHGWTGTSNAEIETKIRKAYLANGKFNVFAVDWSSGAISEYILARNRVEAVGQTVARFITFLNKETGMPLSSVTIVGHSLGAHVAGFAGKNTRSVGTVEAIVGLDPAYPFFSYEKPHERLNATDANYVEIIHTNGGYAGIVEPIGHVDFYPNYGTHQPDCPIIGHFICSHSRSYIYFAESITTATGFWARQCGDYNDILNENCTTTNAVYAVMGGEPVKKKTRGIFWLSTNGESPFAQGRPSEWTK